MFATLIAADRGSGSSWIVTNEIVKYQENMDKIYYFNNINNPVFEIENEYDTFTSIYDRTHDDLENKLFVFGGGITNYDIFNTKQFRDMIVNGKDKNISCIVSVSKYYDFIPRVLAKFDNVYCIDKSDKYYNYFRFISNDKYKEKMNELDRFHFLYRNNKDHDINDDTFTSCYPGNKFDDVNTDLFY